MTRLVRSLVPIIALLSASVAAGEEKIVLTGRVVDPAGRAVAGAKLEAAGRFRATADADGRYRLEVAEDKLERIRLIAAAPGHAPYVAEVKAISMESDIKLPKAVPLQGRIISLEGQPVVGAEVRVVALDVFGWGQLERYLSATEVKDKGFPDFTSARKLANVESAEFARVMPELTAPVRTDRDGRFSIPNIGDDRLVHFNLRAPMIQHIRLAARTSAGRPIRIYGDAAGIITVLGSPFDYLAQPSRLLRGVVRERGTGQPVVGVAITSPETTSVAVTDADGRYELAGCPKAPAYKVTATPSSTTPAFTATRRVDDAEGLVPVTADINLLPGIRVTGRVFDGRTDEPVTGAARYFPLPGNDYLETKADTPRTRYSTSPARVVRLPGEYSVVVAPGPGVITVEADEQAYLPAQVDPRFILPGYTGDRSNWGNILMLNLERQRGMYWPVAQASFRAIEPINPLPGTPAFDFDIKLTPVPGAAGRFVDPEGKPLTGVWASGLPSADGKRNVGRRVDKSDFTIPDVNPNRPLTFYAVDARRDLCGKFTVRGDETRRIEFRLAPGATLTGRLVDENRKPISGVVIWPKWSEPGANLYWYANLPKMPRTDANGKFTVPWLITGHDLGLGIAQGAYENIISDLRTGIGPLKPGETRDLGDLQYVPPRY